MRRILISGILLLLFSCTTLFSQHVKLVDNEKGRKVEVFIDGRQFTTFIYPADLEKPVLFPVFAPNGSVITRGFPLAPAKGERTDHPHQTGLWFNHGAVNGLDFWGNSSAIPETQKVKCGRIVVKRILKVESGTTGKIEVLSDWVDHSGAIVISERATWVFSGNGNLWTIDHQSVLTAPNGDVTFADSKEGMFAIRAGRAFEMPSNEPLILADGSGNSPEAKNNYYSGISGMYHSSSGKSGDDVWGTRNRWVVLTGKKDNTTVSMAIFDNPSNPGFPAYAHARGYGLFSLNNFGVKAFDPSQKENNFVIRKGSSVSLRHRFCVQSGTEITSAEAEEICDNFSKEYK